MGTNTRSSVSTCGFVVGTVVDVAKLGTDVIASDEALGDETDDVGSSSKTNLSFSRFGSNLKCSLQ